MKPLAGITILDFSRVLAGPMATQILAELGAEVIKIEQRGVGDESRTWEPQLVQGESAYFFAFNRSKQSITLNLKLERGQQIARMLAAKADVVVENFLPGTMERMGLDYATLSSLNPRLVYISNTGFGQTGPYRDRKGYDTIFQALSGIMNLTGYPDAPPAKVGVPIADLTAGLWIVISALTGIVARTSSGRGSYVDLAMMDVQVSLLALAAARMFAYGEDPERMGTEHPGRVPSAAFPCADDLWIHVSASDQHWPALCRILGMDDLADVGLETNAARLLNRTMIMSRLREAIRRHPRSELAEMLRAADIPAGEVNSVREILSDPHVKAREMVQSFEHPKVGRFSALRTPIRLSGFESDSVKSPPLLGADTDEVLKRHLALAVGELAELRAAKVI